MPPSTKKTIVCISHKEDVDGISSAVLIKAAFKANSVILVDYANMISHLEKLRSGGKKIDKLFICDLGLSKKNEGRFVEILEDLVKKGAQVTYIDHHDVGKPTVDAIKKIGVTLVHTIEECTSVQIYNKYKKKLPAHAAFFAAAGALTDYMEAKPIASKIVSRFDRQFLMLESTALSYMISSNQHKDDFLVSIVDTLSSMKFPHDIENGFAIAQKYAEKIANAIGAIMESAKMKDNLAYAPSTIELSASMVVNSVLGMSGKPVALVYKFKEDINAYVISIRGSKECNVHLGRLVNEIVTDLGGSGGGHDRACGAMVPKDRLEEFATALDKKIVA